MCDKRAESDKRNQSGEQEVCEKLASLEFEEQERDEEERERDKEIEKDVVDWTKVTRNKRQSKRTVQIFVKVDGSRAITREMALSDKVSDVAKRSVCCSKSDVYVTSGGRVLRRSEELRSQGRKHSGGYWQDDRRRETQG